VTKPGNGVTRHTSVASSRSAAAAGRVGRRPDGHCSVTAPLLPASHLPGAAADDDDWWTHGPCPTSGVVVQLVLDTPDAARP